MKLQTTTPVTHADVTKKLQGGTTESVVTMTINRFAFTSSNGVEVPFKYEDGNGNVLETEVKSPFRVPADQVKAMSQSVNALVAPTDNILDRMWEEIKAVAKTQMSTSLGIDISQIEEVIEA